MERVQVELEQEGDLCKKIELHVLECSKCQKQLQFNPIEKALLKSYSIRNDIFELVTFIATGIFMIIILELMIRFQK
jgi:hypothetical protein